MSSLYNLAYISRNTISGDSQTVREELSRILTTAQRNNRARGVTGALLYSGGYFCQVLEGPEEVVEDLFEVIQMDDRHGDVTVLHFEPIEARGFGDWAMALAGVEDTMRFDIEGLLQSKDELAIKDTGRNLVTVLDQLVRQHQSTLK